MWSSKHLVTPKTHQKIASILTAEKFKTYTFGTNGTVTKTMKAMRLYYQQHNSLTTLLTSKTQNREHTTSKFRQKS